MSEHMQDKNGVLVQGHIKIFDPESQKVYIDKRNAIHYENMSIAMAESLANAGQGYIYEMSFGNGGTSVDPTGIITYLTPNSTGTNASLYNQTYTKVVDDRSVNNTDPARNKLETRHVAGTNYTDIVVTCGGTVGLEFACLGKPVVLAANPPYSNLGFTMNNISKEDYEKNLLNCHLIEKLNKAINKALLNPTITKKLHELQ